MNCCNVCEALQLTIKKCDDEMEKIKNGTVTLPYSIPDDKIDTFNATLEERHEYLENFRSKLNFLLNDKNRKEMGV